MRNTARLLIVSLGLSLSLGLGGCGYLFGDDGLFPDRSREYREAVELPPMDLPPGRQSETLEPIYPIPPVTAEERAQMRNGVPRPEPLLAANAAQLVRIQRLGDDSWALIGIPPGQLWPQVRSFLSAANMSIARADARAGIMESTYLDLQGQSRPARFRFRIERGVQRGNSELHVLQMFQPGSDAGQGWPEQSDDTELEGEMLRSIAQFIANSADTAPVSMIADQAISAGGKVTIEETPGESYIRLELGFARGWASLARALEESGFEITDRDRSAGRYYVTYRGEDADEKGGWFSWFGGGDDDEHPLTGKPLLVDVTDKGSDLLEIRLRSEVSEPAATDEAIQSLLQLIKGNID